MLDFIKNLWFDLIGKEDKTSLKSLKEKNNYRLTVAAIVAAIAVAGIPLTGGWSLLLLLVSARKLHLVATDKH